VKQSHSKEDACGKAIQEGKDRVVPCDSWY
jgi:hypothetical protein